MKNNKIKKYQKPRNIKKRVISSLLGTLLIGGAVVAIVPQTRNWIVDKYHLIQNLGDTRPYKTKLEEIQESYNEKLFELSEKEKAINNLEINIASKLIKISELEFNLETTISTLNEKTLALNEKTAENERLLKIVEENNAKILTLEENNSLKLKEVERLNQLIIEINNEILQLESDAVLNSSEIVRLQGLVSLAEEQITVLNGDIISNNELIATLNSQLLNAETTIAANVLSISSLTSAKLALETQVNLKNQEITALSSELNELNLTLNELNNENMLLEAEVLGFADTIGFLEDKAASWSMGMPLQLESQNDEGATFALPASLPVGTTSTKITSGQTQFNEDSYSISGRFLTIKKSALKGLSENGSNLFIDFSAMRETAKFGTFSVSSYYADYSNEITFPVELPDENIPFEIPASLKNELEGKPQISLIFDIEDLSYKDSRVDKEFQFVFYYDDARILGFYGEAPEYDDEQNNISWLTTNVYYIINNEIIHEETVEKELNYAYGWNEYNYINFKYTHFQGQILITYTYPNGNVNSYSVINFLELEESYNVYGWSTPKLDANCLNFYMNIGDYLIVKNGDVEIGRTRRVSNGGSYTAEDFGLEKEYPGPLDWKGFTVQSFYDDGIPASRQYTL